MTTHTLDEDDLDRDNPFDVVEHEKTKEQTKELKKNNLRAVFGAGPGRLALIAVVFSFVVLVAFGAYNIFKRKPPEQGPMPDANAAMLSAPGGRGDAAVVSEEEAQLRRQAANQYAAEAAAAGKPYLAPPIIRAAPEETAVASVGATQANMAGAVSVSGATAPVGPGAAVPQKTQAQLDMEQASAQAAAAQAAPAPVYAPPPMPANWDQTKKDQINPQIFKALGRTEQGESRPTFASTHYTLPDRAALSAAATTSATPQAGVVPSPTGGAINAGTGARGPLLFQAGDGHYCELDFKINTDASRNDAQVTCLQGQLNGARLIGKWEASREGAVDGSVSVFLTLLSLPGRPAIPIQAIAIEESTGEQGMADEVQNHSVRKYGGLAVASFLRGLGRAASIVTGTTTTISTGTTATTQTVMEPLTPARQAKIAMGEVGVAIGDSLQRSSEQIKRTVKVERGKGVRVVFLADVFDEKK